MAVISAEKPLLIPALTFQPMQAQILRRIKEKADQITNKVIDPIHFIARVYLR